MTHYNINLDLTRYETQLVLSCKKTDVGREVVITFHEGGKPYMLTSDNYAVFVAKKPSGADIVNDCVLDLVNNCVRYTMTPQTVSDIGTTHCEIQLFGYNRTQIGSPTFNILVRESLLGETNIESSNEYNALNTIYSDIKRSYEHGEFKGDSVFIRFSAYADGTEFTEMHTVGQSYIGVATGQEAPSDKSEYQWSLFEVQAELFTDLVIGKNLLDISKVQKATRFDDAGNIITGSDATTACITDYIPVKSGDTIYVSYTVDGALKYLNARRILGYDKDKNFIGLLGSSTSYQTLIGEGLAYIRLQLTTASAESGGQIELGYTRTTYAPYEEHRILSENRALAAHNSYIKFPTKYASDLTVVGDRIWGFKESSAIGTMDGAIWIMALDEVGRTGTYMQGATAIKHDFGHVNTIDYCKNTDCLVFGNGSGVYGVAGKFYVIPNAHKLAENMTNAIVDLAIEYDCTAYNFGDKLNVCWGHENMGRYDIVILITNDNKNIRFAQLGKGANNLGLGTLIAGKGADEFNGTFKVINEYTLDDGTTHPNNVNCNQGSAYYGGKLYVSVGHEPHRHWEIMFGSNGKASYVEVYEPMYDDTGNAIAGATEGMCVTDHYIITMENGTFTSGEDYKSILCIKRRK